jgi:RNA polymerase sigma-32 factor
VAKIAMGYRGYGLPIGEVISEGNVGLMQAVKRFEPDKGFRLATYAMWWIRASIQEYILRSWSAGENGHHRRAEEAVLQPAQGQGPDLGARGGRSASPSRSKQIATKLGVTEEDVIDMNRRLGGDASLNAPMREDGEGEWQDWLVDDSARARSGALPTARRATIAIAALRGAGRSQRARAAHLRGAPSRRRAGDAGGSVDRVRRLARARAPDRGARLRELPPPPRQLERVAAR